ncbi:Protease synthase and sporulation negative regulatory protein PAI 1 [Nocardia otitidiscaviarum]|uniref:Protease synthase and sporulation negative regulatory protein PAI 1 n=1 Tax=Nocardia otitidiscaviarum TaxID=1823 RepID=A0A378YT90_9NOCA|nr:Protease synthase and sporulation negative regulatory protein PAI 1 [Nocardia otitidiscaviarum]
MPDIACVQIPFATPPGAPPRRSHPCFTGRVSSNPTVTVELAAPADAAALGEVAAVTFPLACPPGAGAADIAAFIADVLSPRRFTDYLADPARTVLKAVADGRVIGYSLLVAAEPTDPDVAAAVTLRPVTELSKMYVLPGHHGNGVAAALMAASLDRARTADSAGVWLGVNQENQRAQSFYAKHGFQVVGTKTFLVGAQLHSDFVMQRVF